MSNTKFLIIYLILMVLTYLWRFAAFGAAMEEGADAEAMGSTASVLLLFTYAGMAWAAYARGKAIEKGYLISFPIVGAVFDILLPFIPFIPTVMNIITIVVGMPDNKQASASQSPS